MATLEPILDADAAEAAQAAPKTDQVDQAVEQPATSQPGSEVEPPLPSLFFDEVESQGDDGDEPIVKRLKSIKHENLEA